MSWFFLFAPGAGASSDHPRMRAWATRLETIAPVERFDYDYRVAGKKLPDKLPKLLDAHRRARDAAMIRHPGRRCILVGRSMGGRVGFHLAADEPASPAIALGYPLVAPSGARRTEALLGLRLPALVVQGTRDTFGGPELIRQVGAPVEVVAVSGADHELVVPRRHPEPQEAVDDGILAAIAAFVGRL